MSTERQPDTAPEPDALRALVIGALEEMKADDIVTVDVRGRTSVTDFLVIATGRSDRHVKSCADRVLELAKAAGAPPLGVEGQREGEWVLVDLADVVVHVMLARVRDFYNLEKLWSVDAVQAAREQSH